MPPAPYKQHAPFSIQIELVEGCTMLCSFCGVRGIRSKPNDFKFASLETIKQLATEIARLNWTPRIEFAMHGEPSIHPQAAEAVEIVRKANPKLSLMMTSNGAGFVKQPKLINRLREAGLNVLALDNYRHSTNVPTILENLKDSSLIVRHYPEDRSASAYRKRRASEFEIIVMADITTLTSGNHVLANHAGQAAKPDYSKQRQRCAFPFRELSVRWDGNVSLCCDDFRGVYKVGNINEQPLDRLWNSPAFQAARRKLYHRQRDFAPCLGCNAVSFRVGLLPDPTGQDDLPKPSKLDAQIIKEANRGKPYTTPVLRPWEKHDAGDD